MSTSCRWEQVFLQHLFISHVCQADGVQRTWSTWPTPGSRPASGAGGELEGRRREAGRRVAGRRYLGPCGHPRGKDLHPSVLQVQSLKNCPKQPIEITSCTIVQVGGGRRRVEYCEVWSHRRDLSCRPPCSWTGWQQYKTKRGD